jgi:cytochrome c oxidase subunit 4
MTPTAPTPAPHHKVNYLAVFLLLVGATILTLLVALHRFESELVNVAIALSIASAKALLVAIFFMHLKFEGKLIYTIAAVPLVLSVILVVGLLPDVPYAQLFTDAKALFIPHH